MFDRCSSHKNRSKLCPGLTRRIVDLCCFLGCKKPYLVHLEKNRIFFLSHGCETFVGHLCPAFPGDRSHGQCRLAAVCSVFVYIIGLWWSVRLSICSLSDSRIHAALLASTRLSRSIWWAEDLDLVLKRTHASFPNESLASAVYVHVGCDFAIRNWPDKPHRSKG